jgi:hypothetical protein
MHFVGFTSTHIYIHFARSQPHRKITITAEENPFPSTICFMCVYMCGKASQNTKLAIASWGIICHDMGMMNVCVMRRFYLIVLPTSLDPFHELCCAWLANLAMASMYSRAAAAEPEQ